MIFELRPPLPAHIAVLTELIKTYSLAVGGTRRAIIDEDGELRTARTGSIRGMGSGRIVLSVCMKKNDVPGSNGERYPPPL